nr:hypothetical protein [Streptococcus suis]
MRHYISAEWKKLNKIQLLIIGVVFVALSSFIGLGTYFANQSVLIDGTQDKVMWGQLTFYYTQMDTFIYFELFINFMHTSVCLC